MPRSAVIYAPPLPETAYLVAAARRETPRREWQQGLIEVFAELERHDRTRAGI